MEIIKHNLYVAIAAAAAAAHLLYKAHFHIWL